MDNFFNQSGKNISSFVSHTETFFYSTIFRFIFGLALVYFLWNVYRFIKEAGNADKRKDHQRAIMWSIIGLAAMFSLWTLVSIITNTFGEPTVIPQIDENYLKSF